MGLKRAFQGVQTGGTCRGNDDCLRGRAAALDNLLKGPIKLMETSGRTSRCGNSDQQEADYKSRDSVTHERAK